MAWEGQRHFILNDWANKQRYQPARLGRNNAVDLPARQRRAHGEKLVQELEALANLAGEHDEDAGVTIVVRSSPEFRLVVKGLEYERSGIELLSVSKVGEVEHACLFVPYEKFEILIKKIRAYIEKDDARSKEARNKALVESIDDIRRAGLEELWTDEITLFPEAGVEAWWEIWTRSKAAADGPFAAYLERSRLVSGRLALRFVDRTVRLVRGTRDQISAAMEETGAIAELRLARVPAVEILDSDYETEQGLIADMVRRIEAPVPGAPAVCLLDNGVLQAHPLLHPALRLEDCFAFRTEWGLVDPAQREHGTPMAGLALHGNLSSGLLVTGAWSLETRLESYKLIHPGDPHPPELYGAVTQAAKRQVEANFDRQRIFCLSITDKDSVNRGRPSSWSSEIDALSLGGDDYGAKRLFVISGGNRDRMVVPDYFEACKRAKIENPGQAWNALTVGAITNLTAISEPEYAGWAPIAPAGGLAPASSTSVDWESNWPIKPELVVEGGNWAQSPANDMVDPPDSLSVLSTSNRHPAQSLTTIGETSGAAADVSRMAAILTARYPTLWPESARGLLVHSAQWTRAMRQQFQGAPRNEEMLRVFGYGIPDLKKASESAASSTVIVAQEELKPFEEDRLFEMKWFPLPWPVEALEAIDAADVTLKVTLSYFVEPNPARRGYKNRYAYASHGLRFEVKRPEDNQRQFLARVNKLAQEGVTVDQVDDDQWELKRNLRSKGSLHCDWLTESGARMASRGAIAVFPISGWWKERKNLRKHIQSVRFSLIVSLETAAQNVDLYAAVAAKVAARIPVEVRRP